MCERACASLAAKCSMGNLYKVDVHEKAICIAIFYGLGAKVKLIGRTVIGNFNDNGIIRGSQQGGNRGGEPRHLNQQSARPHLNFAHLIGMVAKAYCGTRQQHHAKNIKEKAEECDAVFGI